jgi:ABC-type transporter Mla subunit MlaD
MTDTNSGFSDLLLLFGGTNPLGGVVRSVQQFQRGVDEFLGAIENLNRTLDELNGTASRVNSLLDTVEEPIKAFVPQITRTIKTTDRLVEQVSGPLEKALPAMAQLSEIVSSPAATQLPRQLNEMMSTMGDLAKRLQPLAQLAESAGGMFTMPSLSTLRMRTAAATTDTPPPAPAPTTRATPPVATAPAPKKSSAKGSAPKKSPAKKSAPKRSAPKRK